jgi:hypothetical protein
METFNILNKHFIRKVTEKAAQKNVFETFLRLFDQRLEIYKTISYVPPVDTCSLGLESQSSFSNWRQDNKIFSYRRPLTHVES